MGKWMRFVAAFLAILVMVWLGYMLVNGVAGILIDGGMKLSEERDPMFAEEPEEIAPPADLYAEEEQPEHPTLDDYVPDVESPVDMTIEELILEAKNDVKF